MVRMHFLVSGRVQGVGFRNFVYKRAGPLGVQGLVRNLEDGRVEILAAGTSEALREFENTIAKGPAHAFVSSVSSRSLSTVPPELVNVSGFAIAEDGEQPWFVES